MEIFEIVVLIFAYSLGVVTLFLAFICYKRNIEYIETIFLTTSFLLLIVAVTISRFSDFYEQPSWLTSDIIINIPVILLGLSTVLNTFAERKFKPKAMIKYGFIIGFGVLLVLSLIVHFLQVDLSMNYLVMAYLLTAVMYSMMIIRNTKPTARVAHREKIERITAMVCFIVLPVTLFLDLISDQIEFLAPVQSNMGLTLPFLFIFLAGGKLLDDIQRLSLFSSGHEVNHQNIQNYNFTPREQEVAELIIKGHTYQQISDTLFISMPTVKTHVSNIYRKAKVNNKMELLNVLTRAD